MEATTNFAGFDFKTGGADVLKLMKSSFDTAFSNTEKIQDLNQKMLKDMMELGEEIQADTMKIADTLIENAKKGRDQYKKVIETGFKKVEEMI